MDLFSRRSYAASEGSVSGICGDDGWLDRAGSGAVRGVICKAALVIEAISHDFRTALLDRTVVESRLGTRHSVYMGRARRICDT